MKYKHLSDDELQKLIKSYLGGDIQSGDTIIKQYDSLIKKSILKYFKQYDLHIGWSVEDIQQQTRLNILKSLKSFRSDKCSFPFWLIGKSQFCCNRFLRYSRQLKRNHQISAIMISRWQHISPITPSSNQTKSHLRPNFGTS